MDTDRILTGFYVNHRGKGREQHRVLEIRYAQCGRHDDELKRTCNLLLSSECGTHGDNTRKKAEKKIRIEIAFMCFIEDDG